MHLPAILLSFFLLLIVTASGAEAEVGYKFQAGTTNGYRVTIESTSENNPRRFEGIILVGVRSAEENVGTVFFRGRFRPKAVANGGPQFGGPMFHPNHFGQADPWLNFFQFSTLPPFNEA